MRIADKIAARQTFSFEIFPPKGDLPLEEARSVAAELAGLSSSEVSDVLDALEEEMEVASEAMDFETAARLRDQIVAIRTHLEGSSADDVIARLKAGARKGSAHATRRRYRPRRK